eukprot:1222791-Pleurochrysis_carterae.AAC.1
MCVCQREGGRERFRRARACVDESTLSERVFVLARTQSVSLDVKTESCDARPDMPGISAARYTGRSPEGHRMSLAKAAGNRWCDEARRRVTRAWRLRGDGEVNVLECALVRVRAWDWHLGDRCE